MKMNLFFLAIVGGLFIMTSCNTGVKIDQVLQNETTRKQVFEKITADHEMMTGFMEAMISSEHAKMMVIGHKGMQDMMIDKENMMQMMKDNPDMMHSMMSEMMKEGKMMGQMMQMMNKEGMMSEECMQSCMKMMGDKGIDMDNMKEGGNDNNHESHNH